MEVDFSAGIPASKAAQIRLVGSDGKVIYGQVEKGADPVTRVTFPASGRSVTLHRVRVDRTITVVEPQ